jgi:hypothetical protein
MPDPNRLLPLLAKALEAFRTTPGRQGRFLQLTVVDEVLVAGDLHGQVETFKKILELADLANHRKRHLVLQEVVHGPHRYPTTGGDQSHRLLDLIAALKCQYPARVHFLVGNHELAQWAGRAITKNSEDLNQLFWLGVETAYGDKAAEVYAAYQALIAAAPVAVRTPNRVFLSHSLPTGQRLDHWELEDLMLEEHTEEDFKLGGCVHSVVWGRDLSEATVTRYLEKVNADWLISGHIPCEEGFQVPNTRQIILDCKDGHACVCLVPADRPVTLEDLKQRVRRVYAAGLPGAQGATPA